MLLQFIYEGGIVSAMAPPGHLGAGRGGQLPNKQSEVGRCWSGPHLILHQRSPAGSSSSATASFDSLNHGLRKTRDVLMESSDGPDQVIWRVEMGLEATLQSQIL